MPISDTLIADAFRRVYGQMIDDTPPGPPWEELDTIRVRPEAARRSPRAWLVAASAAVVVLVAVGGLAWLAGPTGDRNQAIPGTAAPATTAPSPAQSTTTTTVPTSTTTTTTTTEAPVATPVESAAEIEGEWRLVSGTLDGTQFADETTGGFSMSITGNQIDYPITCNSESAHIEIDNGTFMMDDSGSTLMNCGPLPEASVSFDEALPRVDQIASEPPHLVLRGDGVELVFARPETPAVLGELPLTAAGQLLSFEVTDGRQRTNQYLIVGSPDLLGDTTLYLLTAQTGETPSSWQRWQSLPWPQAPREATVDPAVAVTGPGPDIVLIPDDLVDGDYALCSPFWEPDPFCYTLRVQQPSAPGS